jgi:hypothetical protein
MPLRHFHFLPVLYGRLIPRTEHLAQLALPGGVGFVRAGIKDTDGGIANTYGSFLIPAAIGIGSAVTKRLAITADSCSTSHRSARPSAWADENSISAPT